MLGTHNTSQCCVAPNTLIITLSTIINIINVCVVILYVDTYVESCCLGPASSRCVGLKIRMVYKWNYL